jgi:hypothetical protein
MYLSFIYDGLAFIYLFTLRPSKSVFVIPTDSPRQREFVVSKPVHHEREIESLKYEFHSHLFHFTIAFSVYYVIYCLICVVEVNVTLSSQTLDRRASFPLFPNF